MGTLADLLVVQKCHDVVMTVELIKAHINLWAPTEHELLRGQGDSLADQVEICSLSLQPLTILVPLKPRRIQLSHSNRFVQDHLQTELGNISPH